MKLKKILLPICAAASAAAVVAPTVTSCGVIFRNLLKKYIPTIKPWAGEHGKKDITPAQALEIYLAKNVKDHSIFEDDLMYTMSARFADFPDKNISKGNITKFEASLNNNFLIAKAADQDKLLIQFGMETNLILNDIEVQGLGKIPHAVMNLKWDLPHAAPVSLAFPYINEEEDYKKNSLLIELTGQAGFEMILQATGTYTIGEKTESFALLPSYIKPYLPTIEPAKALPSYVVTEVVLPLLGVTPSHSNDSDIIAKVYLPYFREAKIAQK